MAYRNSIIRKYYTSVANFMSDLWSELNEMGWTLVDNEDASSFRVYSSTNPNGVKGYVKISWTTTQIKCLCFTFWSGQGGSGAGQQYDNYNTLTFSESGTYCWIYGNDQFFYLMSLITSTYYHLLCGHLVPFPNLSTQLTENASNGSNITITVVSTTGFIAGKKYQIVNYGAGHRQWVTVSSITDSTHMVIASLANTYNATTSYIGNAPIIFGGTNADNRFYFTTPLSITGSGSVGASNDYYLTLTSFISSSYLKPNNRAHQFYWITPVGYACDATNYIAYYGYRDDFIFIAPGVNIEDVFLYTLDKNYHISGASSGSNDVNTLNDTSQSWTTNQWANKVVYITSGTGVGQIRKIASNTATQLTVLNNWDAIPVSGSTYQIVDEAYRIGKNLFFALREGY